MEIALTKPIQTFKSDGTPSKTVDKVTVREEATAGDLLEAFAQAQSLRSDPTHVDLVAGAISTLTGLTMGNVRSLSIKDYRRLAKACEYLFDSDTGEETDVPKAG